MGRRPLVAANWKLNGSIGLCKQYAEKLSNAPQIDCWVFPSAVHVSTLAKMFKESAANVRVGVQNIYTEQTGAFTGENSADLARDVGATTVIVGHSERRIHFMESSQGVAHKTAQALDAELTPIICVGEQLDDRDEGQAEEVVEEQLEAVNSHCSTAVWQHVTVAYEPVWAIGSGIAATPEQAQEMHNRIRVMIKNWNEPASKAIRLLYGGSVNSRNAGELISQPDIDGFLVGGASLDIESFGDIVEQARIGDAL